jgi:hypothetical protein
MPGPSPYLSKEAALATAIARRRKYSPRVTKSALVALATENPNGVQGGDRDSEGPLQQRPSQGWGPASESDATDITQYLERAAAANRGFHGSAGQLAQTVQRSAYPDRYDQHSAWADSVLGRLGSSSAPGASNVSRIASSQTGVPGASQARPAQPSVYDVIASYRANTQPKETAAPSNGVTSPYDPVASGQKIQETVAKIQALRAPAQQAMASGDAGVSGIAGNRDAPAAVAQLIEQADKIDAKRMPYVWGGGHAASGVADRGTGRDPGVGLDCSGAVSAVLGIDPRVSGVTLGAERDGSHRRQFLRTTSSGSRSGIQRGCNVWRFYSKQGRLYSVV